MNTKPFSTTDADYMIPWETIEADPGLPPAAKWALRELLGDDQLNLETLETTKVTPEIADLRRCSELDFFKHQGIGKVARSKLKAFLEKHGKKMPVEAMRAEAPPDPWILAARHFKTASEVKGVQPPMLHFLKGLQHAALAFRDLEASVRAIDGKLGEARNTTPPAQRKRP